jgi:hypothetical protein
MSLASIAVNPTFIVTVFSAVLVLCLAAIFFIVIAAGPSTIIDGAFNVLNTSVATGELVINSLVASSAGIVSEGFGLAASAVSQTALVMGQAAEIVIIAAGQIAQVGATLVASSVMINAAVITGTAQVLASGALALTNIVTLYGAQVGFLYLTIEQARIYLLSTLVQNAILTQSAYEQTKFKAISEIWTTMFTSITAAYGQLISIPLIALYGFLSINTALSGVVPSILTALVSVFTALFKRFTSVFTDPTQFIAQIGSIPTVLGQKVVEGFQAIVSGLLSALQSTFFP